MMNKKIVAVCHDFGLSIVIANSCFNNYKKNCKKISQNDQKINIYLRNFNFSQKCPAKNQQSNFHCNNLISSHLDTLKAHI